MFWMCKESFPRSRALRASLHCDTILKVPNMDRFVTEFGAEEDGEMEQVGWFGCGSQMPTPTHTHWFSIFLRSFYSYDISTTRWQEEAVNKAGGGGGGKEKPADWQGIFGGNMDDDFKLGISFTPTRFNQGPTANTRFVVMKARMF